MRTSRHFAALSLAASSIALATGAMAQTAPATSQPTTQNGADAAPPAEEAAPDIVVTGTAASIENAENTKRKAGVLIDGISADQIGALPDVSVAEALVRVPGVGAVNTILGFDQISVRGLGADLTSVQYNGRLMPTLSAIDRRVPLSTLPTEGIAAVNVQKTADAVTVEGGVAGTVNSIPVQPFETKRRGFTAVVRGIYSDTASKVHGPYEIGQLGVRAEAGYVGKITDNLGVALSYAYLQQSNVAGTIQFDTYRTITGPRADPNKDGVADAYPNNVSSYLDYANLRRHAVLGTVQWDPTPSLRVSLDGLYINGKSQIGPIRFLGVGADSATAPVPTVANVTNNVVTQYDGTVSLYRLSMYIQNRLQAQMEGGLNVKFDNGGPIKFNIDGYYARAVQTVPSIIAFAENDAANAAGQIQPVSYDITDQDHPVLNFRPLTADDYALSQINRTANRNTDTIKSLRADFTYVTGTGPISSFTGGFRIEGRDKIYQPVGTTYSWTNLATRPDLDSSYLAASTNPYLKIAQYLGGPGAVNYPLFDAVKLTALQTAPGVTVNNLVPSNLAGYSFVTETTYALYGQMNLEQGPLTGNMGVRYVLTDQIVRGLQGTTVANATPVRVRNSYAYVLPSINLKYALTDTLAFRAAGSKSMSRPVFSALRVGTPVDLNTVPTGVLAISVGNPRLMPFTSQNVDLSVEWYPNSATSLSVQGYYKWVSNFTTTRTVPGTITLNNGQVVPTQVTTSFNDPTVRHFRGVEVIGRRTLDFLPGIFSSLGVQANWNHNITDAVEFLPSVNTSVATVTPNSLARDSVNAQLYFSRPTVDLRLAYRWVAPNTRVAFGSFQKIPSELDLSGSVEVIKGIRLAGYIQNLTKAREVEYIPDTRDPDSESLLRRSVYNGRVITFGVRAAF